MSVAQDCSFKVEDVDLWSAPMSKAKPIQHEGTGNDWDDDEPTHKVRTRRQNKATHRASEVSRKRDAHFKRGALDSKVTKHNSRKPDNRVLHSSGTRSISLALRPLRTYANTSHGSPRTTTAAAGSPVRPSKPRAPRPPVVPKFDPEGNKIPCSNVHWNEPVMVNLLFGIVQAVSTDPTIDMGRFFQRVGTIVTHDLRRPISGNAILQRLTKLQNLRRRVMAAAGHPANTVAQMMAFSQEHQRGNQFVGPYSSKDLRRAALKAPVATDIEMRTMLQLQADAGDEEEGEEEEEEEEEEDDCMEDESEHEEQSAVEYLTPAEWVAVAIPDVRGPLQESTSPSWISTSSTPPVAPTPRDLTPEQCYAWGSVPVGDEAWLTEVSAGFPMLNAEFTPTGEEYSITNGADM